MTESEQKPAHRSTQRVLDILSTLCDSDEGMGMADICRALNAPKSSLFPILHTMADNGYIAYDENTGRYSIGIRSYLLGASYRSGDGVLEVFESAMRRVVAACEETSQLGVLDRDRILYIAKVDSPQPVLLRSNIGKTLGISYTAIGKALVSDWDDRDVRAIVREPLERPTEHAVATVDDFVAELGEVRRTGVAYDREETTPGVQCIAVPVLEHGHVAYGLSVTVPSYRLTPEKTELIIGALRAAKRDVERAIS